jgi:hypothetical protein
MLRAVKMTSRWIILLGGLVLISTPSQAITIELARKCRAMALDAHPTQLWGMNGSATPQREFYNACVARNGDMPDQTTGSGTPSGN